MADKVSRKYHIGADPYGKDNSKAGITVSKVEGDNVEIVDTYEYVSPKAFKRFVVYVILLLALAFLMGYCMGLQDDFF